MINDLNWMTPIERKLFGTHLSNNCRKYLAHIFKGKFIGTDMTHATSTLIISRMDVFKFCKHTHKMRLILQYQAFEKRSSVFISLISYRFFPPPRFWTRYIFFTAKQPTNQNTEPCLHFLTNQNSSLQFYW